MGPHEALATVMTLVIWSRMRACIRSVASPCERRTSSLGIDYAMGCQEKGSQIDGRSAP